MFRKLRIAVLLVILATVALGAWRSGARATEWKHTLYATVYPIAADDSPHTRAGVARLSADVEVADGAKQRQQGREQVFGRGPRRGAGGLHHAHGPALAGFEVDVVAAFVDAPHGHQARRKVQQRLAHAQPRRHHQRISLVQVRAQGLRIARQLWPIIHVVARSQPLAGIGSQVFQQQYLHAHPRFAQSMRRPYRPTLLTAG